MAPNRRKGAGKAAAAAAACRQWKVGDLVLAKVKGFPAWPATVSEPEKWGYAADWKKVLVYFFGTQQIAFCNPADVEAFTEEKKQSLLVKRQGKGADFVRAVQEIIDSYENSKNQDQVNGLNSGEEVTLVNGGHSMESSANFDLKDQTETSEATVTGRDEPNFASGIALEAPQSGSLHDKESLLEQPCDNVTVTAKPGITTYTSRKRSGGIRCRKRGTQKTNSSVERPGNVSQLEPCRFQNFMRASSEGNKSSGDLLTDIISERSLRRNKIIRKSPDVSEWDDVESSAFVSNRSIGDNGSEIATVDSDFLSMNEGSTIDSASKPEDSETFVECSEGDVESSKGLDFQINAVVAKKKRNLNRKRVTNEAAEPLAKMEVEVYMNARVHDSYQNSQSASENLNEKHNKEDGDEHLPLVKRARVRMSKLSCLEEHASFSQAEEKTSNVVAFNTNGNNSLFQVEGRTSNEVAVATVDRIGPSTNFCSDCSANTASVSLKGSVDDAPVPHVIEEIPANRSQLLMVKENQSFGYSADGEAALPPSKRLHRALEAMSANVAEEGQECAKTSMIKTSINDGFTRLLKSPDHMVIDKEENDGLGARSAESFGHEVSAFSSSSKQILDESIRSLVDADVCKETIEISTSQIHQDNNALGCDYGQDLSGSCFAGHTEDAELSNVGIEKPNEDVHISQSSQLNSSLISLADEATEGTKLIGSNVLQCTADSTDSENAETLRSHNDDNSQANDMHEGAEGITYEQRQKNSCYASFDHFGARDVLVVQSSTVPSDGLESPGQTSPPTTLICHVSTAESANFVQDNGCSSPDHSQQKTSMCTLIVDEEKIDPVVPQHPKSVGKWSSYAEAHAALSSFEGMLGSLTRTKESIGRATRIAIDCAKFGVSSKVVEILARSLESESSLHRRVDLFFLVDSITQCSRSLKGDGGGVYPSAIQAVLPRLISAAAPPGIFAQENRRQCLKVLRLWLERKILPESVIRRHMRELDSLGGSSSAGPYSRRSARTERPLDDPVREMEGMLVDEYGSNSSFQLPGFCMPRMLTVEDEGSDSDEESFEAVTPEHNSETPEEDVTTPATEKHTCILEDVDGELEMEDVAPSCEVEAICSGCVGGVDALQNCESRLEHFSSPSLTSLPLPPPPPPPPPPLPAPPLSGMDTCYINGIDSNHYTNNDLHEDLGESVAQQSATLRITPSVSNGVHYYSTEDKDQMQMQLCDSTSSFSNYPVCPVNNAHVTDRPNFHHKAYPPRPPHPLPSNQFSYVQAGQHAKCQRSSPPPSYNHWYQSSHNDDGGYFYNNHERMRPAPYDESWRYPPPPFPGSRYPDKPYPPGSYGGPPRERNRMPRQGWSYPPRATHHRNFMPFRPPTYGSEVPVSSRAPSIWRPR